MRAMVVENFGTRTTRTGVGHLPEVVAGIRRTFIVADANNSFGRQADDFVPDFKGFVVGVINGDQ